MNVYHMKIIMNLKAIFVQFSNQYHNVANYQNIKDLNNILSNLQLIINVYQIA